MKHIILLLFLSVVLMQRANAQAFTREKSADAVKLSNGLTPLRIIPNPAINTTTVYLAYIPTQKVYIDILDFNGQVRRSFAFNPGSRALAFNVAFLTRGYYALRVYEDEHLVGMGKMVKE